MRVTSFAQDSKPYEPAPPPMYSYTSAKDSPSVSRPKEVTTDEFLDQPGVPGPESRGAKEQTATTDRIPQAAEGTYLAAPVYEVPPNLFSMSHMPVPPPDSHQHNDFGGTTMSFGNRNRDCGNVENSNNNHFNGYTQPVTPRPPIRNYSRFGNDNQGCGNVKNSNNTRVNLNTNAYHRRGPLREE
ncbi:hypothetical protein C7212DRAFT_362449 [Tuber magnatum]|uniref:Uncharacterized protein n=1 Tax=Tuber magnatum TaxID=42249 RepID=A0A317SU25_9PEZI|nr:hypothetical protein C7212DRAFT_362449 [Tuber magnatum]